MLMELLICISILVLPVLPSQAAIVFYYFIIFNNTLSVVLYGAVEHWMSGALVNVGDMI